MKEKIIQIVIEAETSTAFGSIFFLTDLGRVLMGANNGNTYKDITPDLTKN